MIKDLTGCTITKIQALSWSDQGHKHPVFLVRAQGPQGLTDVVVKCEDFAVAVSDNDHRTFGFQIRSLVMISKLYAKFTGRETSVRPLTQTEIDCLKNMPVAVFDSNATDQNIATDANEERTKVKQYFADCLGKMHNSGPFTGQPTKLVIAMEFQNGLLELEQVKGNAMKGACFYDYLRSDSHAAYQLGRIVGIDIVIGNNDRFKKDGTLNGDGKNLFLSKNDNGEYEFIGLDFWDTFSPLVDLTLPPKDVAARNPRQKILTDATVRKAFAGRMIDSLNDLVHATVGATMPNPIPLDRRDDYVAQLEAGIELVVDHMRSLSSDDKKFVSNLAGKSPLVKAKEVEKSKMKAWSKQIDAGFKARLKAIAKWKNAV